MGWSDDILARAKRPRRRRLVAVLALLTLVSMLGAVSGGAVAFERSRSDRLLPGITVFGVEVGGMNRREAVATVSARLAAFRQTRVEFAFGTDRVGATLAELGVDGGVEVAIDEAFARSRRVDSVRRVWRRLRNVSSDIDIEMRLSPDPAKVDAVTRRLAARVQKSPQDVLLKVVRGALEIEDGVPGRWLDIRVAEGIVYDAAVRAIAATLQGEPVPLPVSIVEPAATARDVRVVLVVRIDEQKLYLYRDGNVAGDFSVASGLYGYDTPLGDYRIVEKVLYPWWYNPAPHGWGRSMPLSIPPGPGNPLGTRAIGIDHPGIFLHETLGGVGYRASHGCIRMQPTDLRSFFDDVPLGSPVLIMDGPETYTPEIVFSGDSSEEEASEGTSIQASV